MAAGFSVKDALNKNSKAGIDESPRARFRTKDISIFKMYRNDMNFYSVEQIEELAGDILMYGLKQNLELVYAPCDRCHVSHGIAARCLSACHRQSVGCRPDTDGATVAPFRLLFVHYVLYSCHCQRKSCLSSVCLFSSPH